MSSARESAEMIRSLRRIEQMLEAIATWMVVAGNPNQQPDPPDHFPGSGDVTEPPDTPPPADPVPTELSPGPTPEPPPGTEEPA